MKEKLIANEGLDSFVAGGVGGGPLLITRGNFMGHV